jgi:hypothetical protein
MRRATLTVLFIAIALAASAPVSASAPASVGGGRAVPESIRGERRAEDHAVRKVAFGVAQPRGTSFAGARAAGFSSVLVQAVWSKLQPTGSTQLDPWALADVRARIEAAHRAGLGVVFELALHYPPDWALADIAPFRDQQGRAWLAPGQPGMDVRDWIWTRRGREAVHRYVGLTLRALGPRTLREVERVRLGGGTFGELQYPPVGSPANPSWWSYGACTMPVADLAADQQPCPAGAAAPSPLGSWNESDQAYADWHMRGLSVFVVWLVREFRSAGWRGPISVLHPGFGLRDDDDPTSTDWPGLAYREFAAQGLNWDDQIHAYSRLADVWPWSTWLDASDPHLPATRDSDRAPWRKLAEVAHRYGRSGQMWGENTGATSAGGFQRMTRLATAAGYSGIVWFMPDSSLVSADPSPARRLLRADSPA